MIPEIFQQILNLFDDCHSRGKSLEINIDQDLIKIYPLPHKLIVDLLIDEPSVSAISYLSNDQHTLCFENNLSLCPQDQNQGGQCDSSTCQQLHICRDYLLNNNCSQFKSFGKCSHSHSLSTNHNEQILKKFNLSSEDQQIFELISRLNRLSPPSNQSKILVQSVNRQDISDDLIDQWLGQHKSLLIDQRLIDPFTVELIFDDDEVTSMMESFIAKQHSTTALIMKKNIPSNVLFSNNSLNFDKNLNKQSKIIPIENQDVSKLNNDRHENDLDQEVQLTNEKALLDRPFANQLNTNLTKSSSEHPVPITIGRGRGRQTHNTIPNAPSISRDSLLNNQSSQNLTSKLSPANDQSSSTEKKFSFSHRLQSKPNEQVSQQIKTKSSNSSLSSTPEITANNTNNTSDQFSQHNPSESFTRSFLPKLRQKQNNENEIQINNSSPPNNVPNEIISSPTREDGNSKPRYVLRRHSSKTKEKSPILTRNQTPITYIYTKPFTDEHLCYLLGPGRQHIIEQDHSQILSCLPSGYCRLTNIEQGKTIEKQLYSILPERLNIELVKINDDDLALFICSSAGEKIFEQNQTHYAIISEPTNVRLNIEVIEAASVERRESSSISTTNTRSSSTEQKHSEESSSDGKFHISSTNSSIDVITGDISQVPVDMMICISTSNNLRDSVLRRAGPNIESEYKKRYRSNDALLLNGGSTKAHKILFVPWQTEIEETEETTTQKSLSDLVKWCIDQAHDRNMKSISFPPIGTGQLGLDPFFVCEAMISAASERLHQYEIDVLFVIYSSNGMNDEDECYQVFRIYLNSLSEEITAKKVSTPTINNERRISKNSDTKKRSIRRDVQSKRIITLSDSRNLNQDHNLLIKSLEKLMFEKTFDLSLAEPSLIDEVDLLVDICLQNHVYPRIDYSREELTLRGDRDSCLQCFFNLRQGKKVHQYSYVSTENGEKSDEKDFNSYISLKIDEAFAVGETNISIEHDDQIIFNIDLNKLQVQINNDRQSTFLVKKQLNDSKTRIPSSWSSSLLMIRTVEKTKSSYESLKCVRVFQETMSTADWQIERIDSIENSPLYLHFMNKNKEETKLYFHGCSYSSVQSIIHYGLHSTNASNYGEQFENSSTRSICLTRDVLNSHLYGTRRSSDGKHYLFAVEIAKNDVNDDYILLSNNDAHLALPTYLIVYRRRRNLH